MPHEKKKKTTVPVTTATSTSDMQRHFLHILSYFPFYFSCRCSTKRKTSLFGCRLKPNMLSTRFYRQKFTCGFFSLGSYFACSWYWNSWKMAVKKRNDFVFARSMTENHFNFTFFTTLWTTAQVVKEAYWSILVWSTTQTASESALVFFLVQFCGISPVTVCITYTVPKQFQRAKGGSIGMTFLAYA